MITKVNKTRQGPCGGSWKPSSESCICNMHYKDFKGPSRHKNNILPFYFKQACHTSVVHPPRRILNCVSVTGDEDNKIVGSEDDTPIFEEEASSDDSNGVHVRNHAGGGK